MKTYLFLQLFAFAFLFSCTSREKQELNSEGELIKSVTTFNAPVSSVSYDKDQVYFVGLENGNLIRINKKDDSQRVISVGKGRVYDAVAVDDTIIYVGIRDEGCKKIVKDVVVQTYSIIVPGYYGGEATTNYAPYDIEIYKGDIYMATSSGIYGKQKSDAQNTPLTLLYRPESISSIHFGTHNLRIRNDSLYCATDSGLVVLPVRGIFNKERHRLVTSKPQRKVNQLLLLQDTLYACSDSVVYRKNLKTGQCDSVSYDDKLFAYYPDSSGGIWTLFSNSLKYAKEDKELSYTLPFTLSRSYKNYWAVGKDFLLLACNKHLFFFSKHQNSLGISNHIVAAHTENTHTGKSTCYLITRDNRLYSLSVGSSVPQYMTTIHKLDRGCEVRGLCTSDKYLWMITDRKLYRIKKTNGDAAIVGHSDDYKSLYYADDLKKLYIGMRNDLCCISHPDEPSIGVGAAEAIRPQMEDNFYVTSLIAYKYKDTEKSRIYCATLNSGLFSLEDGGSLSVVAGSDTIGSINKLIELNTEDLLLHTSKGIYLYNHTSGFHFKKDSKELATVFPKEKGLFAIGYSGIGTYASDMQIGTSMAFFDLLLDKVAIASGGKDKLLLGTPSGLYEYEASGKLRLITLMPIGISGWWYVGGLVLGIVVLVVVVLYLRRKKKTGVLLEPDLQDFWKRVNRIHDLLKEGKKDDIASGGYQIVREQKIKDLDERIAKEANAFVGIYACYLRNVFPFMGDKPNAKVYFTVLFLLKIPPQRMLDYPFIKGFKYNNKAIGNEKSKMKKIFEEQPSLKEKNLILKALFECLIKE